MADGAALLANEALPRARRAKKSELFFVVSVRSLVHPEEPPREFMLHCDREQAARMLPGEVCDRVAHWWSVDVLCERGSVKASQIVLTPLDPNRQLRPDEPIPESDQRLRADIVPEVDWATTFLQWPGDVAAKQQVVEFWSRLANLELPTSQRTAPDTREGHEAGRQLEALAFGRSEPTLGEVLQPIVAGAPFAPALAVAMQHERMEAKEGRRYPTSSLPDVQDGAQRIAEAFQHLAGKKHVVVARWISKVLAWNAQAAGVPGGDALVAPLTRDVLELAARTMPGLGRDRWGMSLEFVSLVDLLDTLFQSRLRRGPAEDRDDFEEATREATDLLQRAKHQRGEKTVERVLAYVRRELVGLAR